VLEEGEEEEGETQEEETPEEESPRARLRRLLRPPNPWRTSTSRNYLRMTITPLQTYNEDDDEEDRETPIATSSLHENLMTQLGFLGLNEDKPDWPPAGGQHS